VAVIASLVHSRKQSAQKKIKYTNNTKTNNTQNRILNKMRLVIITNICKLLFMDLTLPAALWPWG
jgi:hypothetical protein